MQTSNFSRLNHTGQQYPGACILGEPGSGKSIAAGHEIEDVLKNTNDRVIVLDSCNAYHYLTVIADGDFYDFSPQSENCINPFDMSGFDDDFSMEKKVKLKGELLAAICSGLFHPHALAEDEALCIKKNVEKLYSSMEEPTLWDFLTALNESGSPVERSIGRVIEAYVKIHLGVFSEKTNIQPEKNLTVFGIGNIAPVSQGTALLICMEQAARLVMENAKRGTRTWIYMDDIRPLLRNRQALDILYHFWEEADVYNAMPCLVCQDIAMLLCQNYTRQILKSSSYVMALKMSEQESNMVSDILEISGVNEKYLKESIYSDYGTGILWIDNNCVRLKNFSGTTDTVVEEVKTPAELLMEDLFRAGDQCVQKGTESNE